MFRIGDLVYLWKDYNNIYQVDSIFSPYNGPQLPGILYRRNMVLYIVFIR